MRGLRQSEDQGLSGWGLGSWGGTGPPSQLDSGGHLHSSCLFPAQSLGTPHSDTCIRKENRPPGEIRRGRGLWASPQEGLRPLPGCLRATPGAVPSSQPLRAQLAVWVTCQSSPSNPSLPGSALPIGGDPGKEPRAGWVRPGVGTGWEVRGILCPPPGIQISPMPPPFWVGKTSSKSAPPLPSAL